MVGVWMLPVMAAVTIDLVIHECPAFWSRPKCWKSSINWPVRTDELTVCASPVSPQPIFTPSSPHATLSHRRRGGRNLLAQRLSVVLGSFVVDIETRTINRLQRPEDRDAGPETSPRRLVDVLGGGDTVLQEIDCLQDPRPSVCAKRYSRGSLGSRRPPCPSGSGVLPSGSPPSPRWLGPGRSRRGARSQPDSSSESPGIVPAVRVLCSTGRSPASWCWLRCIASGGARRSISAKSPSFRHRSVSGADSHDERGVSNNLETWGDVNARNGQCQLSRRQDRVLDQHT